MLVIIKTAEALRNYLDKFRSVETGFVPTMGALHEGHLTLIERSRKTAQKTICSIFVNPTQFNDPADFAKYPKTIEEDILKLESAGCDILYMPSVEDIYREGTINLEHYELGRLETLYEGKYRPGHFQGVCQIMKRLLKIVEPDHLFMGQKDYQQCMVVKEMIRLTGIKTKFHTIPTIRETSGLAMSSRNLRLTEENREKAASIHQAMQLMKDNMRADLQPAISLGQNLLLEQGFKIDYLEFADATTLEPIVNWDGRSDLVILAAVFLQDVRLIDNLLTAR